MSSQRTAHIVGVGISPWKWTKKLLPSAARTQADTHQVALSAAITALLDAGLSYDRIDHAISGGSELGGDGAPFYTLGKTGIPIHSVDLDSCVYTAHHLIQSGGADAVLVVAVDQNDAVALVLASDAFIWHHPYLKDTAISLRSCIMGSSKKGAPVIRSVTQKALDTAGVALTDIQAVETNARPALEFLGLGQNVRSWSARSSLVGLCELVYLLRAWSPRKYSLTNTLQCTTTSSGFVIARLLSRMDGHAAPVVEEYRHKNDGRDRLGFNPATDSRGMTVEDWQAVKARVEFCDDGAEGDVKFPRAGGDRASLAKL